MNVNRNINQTRRQLVTQWQVVVNTIEKLSPVASVRPDDGYALFQATRYSSPNIVGFELAPVVFNLPERANQRDADLFIVVVGQLEIRLGESSNSKVLKTHSFTTRAGYFRRKNNELRHVYGAHYDFAINQVGHPTFHAQLRSFSELSTHIVQKYDQNDMRTVDSMEGLLKTVRLPTAQMDFFSLFLQICADHLLYEQSDPEAVEAFSTLLTKSEFLQGAGYQCNHLTVESAYSCYRSRHWYPRTNAQAASVAV
jgi:hypothetical protein